MMKALTTALAFTAFATAAQAQDAEACRAGADVAESTASLRDSGIREPIAHEILTSAGLPSETAWNMVTYVYMLHADERPSEIYVGFMDRCLGGLY